jgi:hypothetical protein
MAFLKFKKETPVLVGGCNDGTGTFSEPYLYQLHHEIGSSGEARTSEFNTGSYDEYKIYFKVKLKTNTNYRFIMWREI